MSPTGLGFLFRHGMTFLHESIILTSSLSRNRKEKTASISAPFPSETGLFPQPSRNRPGRLREAVFRETLLAFIERRTGYFRLQ
jgi:hypothetical protein